MDGCMHLSLIQRALHFEAGTLKGSVFTLVCSALGTGVLTLPYAFSQLGWVLGSVLLVVSGAVASLTIFILMGAIRVTGSLTYSKMMGKAMNSHRWERVTDGIIVFYVIGCCISYFVFLGDFTPRILEAIPCPEIFRDRTLLLTLSLILIWPLSCVKRLSALRHIALLPIFSIIITSIVVIVQAPHLIHEAFKTGMRPEAFSLSWNSPKAVNIFLFAYMAHVNVVPVAEEIFEREPNTSLLACFKLGVTACLIEFALYAPLAFVGYLSWLGLTRQNFTTNYSATDPAFFLCRILLSISMVVAVPINVFAAAKSCVSLARHLWGRSGVESPSSVSSNGERERENGLESMDGEENNKNKRIAMTLHVSGDSEMDGVSSSYPIARDRTSPMPVPATAASANPNTSTTSNHNGSYSAPLVPVVVSSGLRPPHLDVEQPTITQSSSVTSIPEVPTSVFDRTWFRVFVVSICVLSSYVVALLTSRVADIIGVVGGIFATSFMVSFPAIVYYQEFYHVHPPWLYWTIIIALAAFAMVGYVSTTVIVLQWTGVCCTVTH
ncbi:unnamed protein product [Vitrella brassicaformis CCMP3155]|uniref:Amino acid transporter transmembrane domain-containing protein n=3 Tax=Vitrella brassicaformis TaxID=1169539 RepID=A0A0G4G4W6_VITBC|nr:unnamed protein product [Vitrella brassicaformis CCMP3155]|eukprot:CEM23469.1 unnamed protein product [Vitrella brassicaformis CCMP3155]